MLGYVIGELIVIAIAFGAGYLYGGRVATEAASFFHGAKDAVVAKAEGVASSVASDIKNKL